MDEVGTAAPLDVQGHRNQSAAARVGRFLWHFVQAAEGGTMDKPTFYTIRVAGHLGRDWSDWLAGLEITNLEHGEALLSGTLADQAALYGVLARIRDLNLRLIAVNGIGAAGGAIDNAEGRYQGCGAPFQS